MRLHVRHVSRYRYPHPIYQFASEMHLEPRNNQHQILERFSLTVEPSTTIYSYTDRFQNRVHHFTIPAIATALTIVADSWVTTSTLPIDAAPPTNFLLYESLAPTVRVPFADSVRHWLGRFELSGSSPQVAQVLNQAVFESFQYQSGLTSVQATALDLLDTGAGVCQDFAHFLLALLRLSGIPSVYVSGYVLPWNGVANASHAWVTAYVGEGDEGRWVSLDPVTGRETDDRYVSVAYGRDYDDVTPVRGVYLGPSDEVMEVDVSIDQ